MSRLCGCVRGGRLGSVGANCPRLGLLWEAVHPIRRHYTLSDRVYRYVTGVSLRNGCTVTDRVCACSVSTEREARYCVIRPCPAAGRRVFYGRFSLVAFGGRRLGGTPQPGSSPMRHHIPNGTSIATQRGLAAH